jgi:NADPH-dependent curcumin reductase CurA
MSALRDRAVLLRARPRGMPRETDFECVDVAVPPVRDGQFLIQNLYVSLDAGFRQWMNEGSDDEYLRAMELGTPVVGLVLGRVVESRHRDYAVGDLVMGRTAWETRSLADGTDYMTKLAVDPAIPPSYYLGILGPTGLTAYFGMRDVGAPQAGETVVVSTAAGAVGSVAAQIARIHGARSVGLTSTDAKCRWLVEELGLDAAINYRAEGALDAGIRRHCPDGIDVYFDNVGGETLDVILTHLRAGARVVMSGALAAYNATAPVPGPVNMFKVITQRATLKGFMVTDYVAEYPEGIRQLGAWISAGRLKNAEQIVDGIENTARAFCGMFRGENRGKVVVRLAAAGERP